VVLLRKREIDYDSTYSPTLSIDSLKLIIALSLKFNWDLMLLDIKATYFNAPLDKDIYHHPTWGCKLW